MSDFYKILLEFIAILLIFSVFACSPKRVLVVGTSPDFMPYEFFDADGRLSGFDIELIEEIGKRIGRKIEFREMEFTDILPAVVAGNIDAGLSALTITTQRMQEVLFSTPYTTNAQVLVVKYDDDTWDDLEKDAIEERLGGTIRIGTCENYIGYFYAEKVLGETGTLSGYLNFTEAIEALYNDFNDVLIMDRIVALKAAEIEENNIKIIDVTLTTENYGIAMNLNNTKLKDQIDNAITTMIEDGTLERLTIFWKE